MCWSEQSWELGCALSPLVACARLRLSPVCIAEAWFLLCCDFAPLCLKKGKIPTDKDCGGDWSAFVPRTTGHRVFAHISGGK